MPKHLSDKELVQKAQQELPYNTNSFEVLMLRYQSRIFNVCNSVLKDYHLAEDATQNSMLRVFHHLKNFKSESSFFTWIYRISYNESLQIINKNKNYTTAYEDNSFIYDNVDHEIEVEEIFSTLSDDEKELLTFKYVLEFSDEEIANHLGIKLSAAKMRLKRVKERINLKNE